MRTITCRLKTPSSVVRSWSAKGSAQLRGPAHTAERHRRCAGRICPFLDDIYMVAQTLARQDDIQVLSVKDYIAQPKLKRVSQLPHNRAGASLCEKKEAMRVEIQLRTVAMDFWATLEHQMKYKNASADSAELVDALRSCADTIAETSQRLCGSGGT